METYSSYSTFQSDSERRTVIWHSQRVLRREFFSLCKMGNLVSRVVNNVFYKKEMSNFNQRNLNAQSTLLFAVRQQVFNLACLSLKTCNPYLIVHGTVLSLAWFSEAFCTRTGLKNWFFSLIAEANNQKPIVLFWIETKFVLVWFFSPNWKTWKHFVQVKTKCLERPIEMMCSRQNVELNWHSLNRMWNWNDTVQSVSFNFF